MVVSTRCRNLGLSILALIALPLTTGARAVSADPSPEAIPAVGLRVATFNIEDLRTAELLDADSPRPRAVAAIIQQIRPDVLIVNEMAYDQPGAPDWPEGGRAGANAERFCKSFLAVAQADDLEPMPMRGFMAPVNTGIASGFDLDNDGVVRQTHPAPPPVGEDTRTEAGRAYGGDAWGFGTYPGQYGMAILVREGLQIDRDGVRTFRELPWSRMPGALVPRVPSSGESWYSSEEWATMPLASKSFWDIPVVGFDGVRVHFLVSHPTPPAFDGPERRNQFRNHDEIRFWSDYLDGADYIVDDQGRSGGLGPEARFVIVGDLNADPDEGRSYHNPIRRFLLEHPRVQGQFTPRASDRPESEVGDLEPDDTSSWGMRVDYVLPSRGFEIVGGEVVRQDREAQPEAAASDHFLVYVDLSIAPPP